MIEVNKMSCVHGLWKERWQGGKIQHMMIITLAVMETEQEGWSSRPQISHWLCSILQIYFVAIICDLLRIMLEWTLDITEKLYACFIDWQKAYDHVNWTKLIQNTGIDWHSRRLISKLYMDHCVEVWWDQVDTRNVTIGREIRQRCGLYGLLARLHN